MADMRVRGMESHEEHGTSDLKIGLLGLGVGLVWILIVGAFAYWLAI